MQALHRLALEPVAEMVADRNAYGFRPKRSTADALEQCFRALSKKASASWILEGDIRACFDSLSGTWLQANIPMDKKLLTQWLTAGYIANKTFYSTFDGVSQGSIVSPTILVISLSGMEEAIAKVTSRKDKVHMVAYADDFIITGDSQEVLENKVKPVVVAFLKERGLELSEKKTKITHIEDGFDFLGFNVRKYGGKLLIKPSKNNIKTFLGNIRDYIKSHATAKTENLIRQLNPKIRGWANYYRHVVAKRTFNYVDHHMVTVLWRWVKRRHPNKGVSWQKKKYFRRQGFRDWIFSAAVKDNKGNKRPLDLLSASSTPIRRHVKIQASATPYDPAYTQYFKERNKRRYMKEREEGPEDSFLDDITRGVKRTTGSQ